MNKIDAFFVMTSLLLVWLFAIWLLPFNIMIVVYSGIAAWTVGRFIGNVPKKLSKTTDEDFIKDLLEANHAQLTLFDEMMIELRRRGTLIHYAQAKIDQLMFEYCPEDMTAEQIANYEAHQRAVSQQQEDGIEKARRH